MYTKSQRIDPTNPIDPNDPMDRGNLEIVTSGNREIENRKIRKPWKSENHKHPSDRISPITLVGNNPPPSRVKLGRAGSDFLRFPARRYTTTGPFREPFWQFSSRNDRSYKHLAPKRSCRQMNCFAGKLNQNSLFGIKTIHLESNSSGVGNE